MPGCTPQSAAGLLDGDADDLPSTEVLRDAVRRLRSPSTPPQEVSTLERWRELIAEERKGGATAQSVHDYLRRTDPDYTASISAMKRLFAQLAKLLSFPN